MKLKDNVVAFTGGGTGGHIFPGLAVADELKNIAKNNNKEIRIIWLGSSKGMDKSIVEKAVDKDGNKSADLFYGIPSGKLRRYFSFKNFTDLFRIFAGFIKSFFILIKIKPAVLFSKGGFVSVPPCLAARLLKIPVFTHECDFTLGLANKINFKSAKTMFLSYEETKKSLSQAEEKRVIVTGNPIRPIFYNTNKDNGLKFLDISKDNTKAILLVLGGSSGAKQINKLVFDNIEWLCQNFIVVHQTGLLNADDNIVSQLKEKYKENYKAFNFIYQEMPDVLSSSTVVLSRAGANSIWEAAVLLKPMLLIPLCGSGTRGDQVDNARFFEEKNAAKALIGENVNNENLKLHLTEFLNPQIRDNYINSLKILLGEEKPAEKIAKIIYNQLS